MFLKRLEDFRAAKPRGSTKLAVQAFATKRSAMTSVVIPEALPLKTLVEALFATVGATELVYVLLVDEAVCFSRK